MKKGIIIKAVSGFYYVVSGNGTFECKARGIFRKNSESPLVGDLVEMTEVSDSSGVVERVLERKNSLNRPPIANVDKMFIVSSYTTPSPNTLVIDSMVAIAEDKGIEPIIVFNKCDIGGFDDIAAIYRECGFKVYVVSAADDIGIEFIKNELQDCVSVFAGNTGVGKSSILNALSDNLSLKTGDVSTKLGRGRHTTRHVELFELAENTFVADTPGFSSLDVEQSDLLYKENLQFTFREFEQYIGHCKFTSCSHTCEKGCAIIDAVNNKKISQSRYESYKHLYSELSKIKDWEIRKK